MRFIERSTTPSTGLAELLSREHGKTRPDARGDVSGIR